MPKGRTRGKSGLHRARITANGRRGWPQGKCNRDIPPVGTQVRVERRGKSSPAHRRLCCPVNPIRSNTAIKLNIGPMALIRWHWAAAATPCQDRWLFTTEPGLSFHSYNSPHRKGSFALSDVPFLLDYTFCTFYATIRHLYYLTFWQIMVII